MKTIEGKLSDEGKRAANYRMYFSTDDVKADLKGKTIRGGFVTVTGQIAKQSLHIGSTAILARILTPQDYGLIAMVAVVTGFVTLFKDLGLSMATVQREEIDQEKISTLFWVNVALGFAVFLITCCLAIPIGWFYDESRLTWITIGLSIGFLFNGFTVQHKAILKRQMRFPSLLVIDIASFLTGTAAGIVAALMGLKYWALVIMSGSVSLSSLVLTFTLCPWVPELKVNIRKVRSMLRFGFNLTGFSVMNYFSRHADNLLIGKIFGSQSLGLYSKAYSLLLLPLRQINSPIASVVIPALSRLRGSPELYKRYYLGILEKIALITMPGVVFMIIASDWIILLILGPQWIGAAKIFTVLGIAAIVQPVANTTGWLFISQDRTKEQFRWGIIGGTLSILSFIVGLPWGVFGVAASYSLSGLFIRTPLLLWFIGRKGPISTCDCYKALLLPAATSSVFFLILAAIRCFVQILNPLYGLVLLSGAVLLITAAFLFLLPKGRETMQDFKAVARSLWQRPIQN